MTPRPRVYTIAQVATELGVSEKTIDRELAAGTLGRIEIRGAVRITAAQLDDYLARKEAEAPAPIRLPRRKAA